MKFELQGKFRPSSVVFGVFRVLSALLCRLSRQWTFFGDPERPKGCVTAIFGTFRFSARLRDDFRVNFRFSARLRDDLRVTNVAIFGKVFAALWWRFSALQTPTLTVGTPYRNLITGRLETS